MRRRVAIVVGALLVLGLAAFAVVRLGSLHDAPAVVAASKPATCVDAYRVLKLAPSQVSAANPVCLTQSLQLSGEVTGQVAEAYTVTQDSPAPTPMCGEPKRWSAFPQVLLALVAGGKAYRLRISAPGNSEHQSVSISNLADVVELGYVRIAKQLQRIVGQLQLVEPKTARSRRVIAMPATIANGLREHRDRQNAEKKRGGERWNDSGFVFTGPEGRPLDGSAISKQFHRVLERAGLPQRRFHDLRHSCATLLLVQGVSPRVVMDVLGHFQIGLTMNTYSHVIPELRREAADRMDHLLRERERER